ncbi:MAG TPA: AIM24 family protein [Mycobacteriales bacterium]|jgi:uncharacterized protein (AIM24 family)|nr:AIM24 family protein [Mycobacteriales bacterium]
MRSQLFDQANTAVQTTERWVNQNAKLLRVGLGPDVLAVKGSMVAYQGGLTFTHEGAGSASRMLRRMISSDDAPLMRVAGHGVCYFARLAEDIFTLQLEGDAISVDGKRLLAFDASLAWDIKRVQGAGAMATSGLFNTVINGTGNVSITTDGPPLLLDCSQAPVLVDPQAVVCWSANLVPGVVNSMNFRSLLRGGSGEAFQLSFSGPGFVVLQPSEGMAPPAGGGGGGLFG